MFILFYYNDWGNEGKGHLGEHRAKQTLQGVEQVRCPILILAELLPVAAEHAVKELSDVAVEPAPRGFRVSHRPGRARDRRRPPHYDAGCEQMSGSQTQRHFTRTAPYLERFKPTKTVFTSA